MFGEGLSPEVNQLEEFVSYAKSYKMAAKTAAYYRKRMPTSRGPAPRYVAKNESATPKVGARWGNKVYLSLPDVKNGKAKGFTTQFKRREGDTPCPAHEAPRVSPNPRPPNPGRKPIV